MTIIKNNIEIAKIYNGINSIGKIYAGDKLVFGGGVTPTPASSVLVYNEASPSKLTLKAGTYKATVFNPETGQKTVQNYVLSTDTDFEIYDKPSTYFDMTNKTDRLYQFNTADGSSWINNKDAPAKGLDKLNAYIIPEGKMNIAYDGELSLVYYQTASAFQERYNSMMEISTFAPSIYSSTSGKTYDWSFGQKAVYNIPAGRLFEFDVSLSEFYYQTETVPTCTISLTDINTGDVLYTRDQKVNYRSSSDSLFYYGYWSYTHLPPLANVGGKTIALNITYNNLKLTYNPNLSQQITPQYSISGKLYDPSTPDPVTVEIMIFGDRPDIRVRTYREEEAERLPNGLCGTIHFDSEMNVKSVT